MKSILTWYENPKRNDFVGRLSLSSPLVHLLAYSHVWLSPPSLLPSLPSLLKRRVYSQVKSIKGGRKVKSYEFTSQFASLITMQRILKVYFTTLVSLMNSVC